MKNECNCSTERIQEYLDGRLSPPESALFEAHVQECERCSVALSDLKRIDTSLRDIPLVRTSKTFTRSVMEQLGIASGTTVAFRMLEGVAYFFGLLVMAALTLTVLVLSGVMKIEQIAEGQGVATDSAARAGAFIGSLMEGLTRALVQYFPFLFGSGSSSIAVAVVFLVLALLLVDRLVMRRMLGR